MYKKTTQTLILLGILLVLIIVYLIWQNPFQSKQNLPDTDTLISANFESIKKIDIKTSAQEIILAYKDNQWVVESEQDFVANQSLVEDLINGLKNAKQGKIISRNPDKASLFNLNSETAIILKLKDDQDNQLEEIYIGNVSGSANDQTYVKNQSSDNILLVNGNLNTLINQPTWLMVETEEPETEDAFETDEGISPFETKDDSTDNSEE